MKKESLPEKLCENTVSITSPKDRPKRKNGDLLLVIDMQNAYTVAGPWTCPHMARAAERITTLIDSGHFEQVIFTRFDAPRLPVGTWKDYNEINREVNEDADLNELIPQLRPYTDVYPLYSKSVYSAMSVTGIQSAVKECIERGGAVVLTGVVSECCVLATAFGAIDMGCPVIFITDACAGISDETEEAVVRVLSGLDYVQTTILDTAGYLERSENRR